MPVNLKGRSFLTLKDFTPDEIRYMLNLAADLKLTSLFVGDNALVGGKDSYAKTAKYFRQVLFVSVYTQTRFGNSLQAGDDLLILICTVFQLDVDSFEYAILDNVIFLNVTLIQKDIGDCNFHFGCRYIYSIMFRSVSVTDSCKHICNRITHVH